MNERLRFLRIKMDRWISISLLAVITLLTVNQSAGWAKAEQILGEYSHWNRYGGSEFYTASKNEKDRILSIRIHKETAGKVLPQLVHKVNSAFQKGTVLKVRMRARSAESIPLTVVFEHRSSPWEKELFQHVILQPKWTEYSIPFRLSKDIPTHWAVLALQLPRLKGTLEISDLRLEDCGIGRQHRPSNLSVNPYAGRELDPNWWHEAEQRIDAIRKTSLNVLVVDKAGKPIPNAVVHVEQKSHQFNFGTAISSQALFDETKTGEKYRNYITSLFNCVTIENELKWYHHPPPELSVEAKRMLDWCKENHLRVRGHYILSPRRSLLPADIRALPAEQLKGIIKEHIQRYLSYFKEPIYVWDLINEASFQADLVDELGPDLMSDTFKWAHEVNSEVLLAYNDYNVIASPGLVPKEQRERILGFAKHLKETSPISSLGIQAHMTLPLPRGDLIWTILDEFEQVALPIEITEYTLPTWDDKLQSDYLKEFMTAIFSHNGVKSFVLWGFWQGNHCAGARGGGLIKTNWSPRPVISMYRNLVFKHWWTDESHKTDSLGKSSFRIFLGDHDVSVRVRGKEIGQFKVNATSAKKVHDISISAKD